MVDICGAAAPLSNSLTLYRYEGFNYVFTPRDASSVSLVSTTTALNSYFTTSTSSISFSAPSNGNGYVGVPSSNEAFVVSSYDICGSVVGTTSNAVTILPGRFVQPVLSNFTFYRNEAITPVQFSAPQGLTIITPFSVPSLPPNLSFTGSGSNYTLTGTPAIANPATSYTIYGKDVSTGSRIITKPITITISNERIVTDVSGSTVITGLTVGSAMTPRVITAIYPYQTSGNLSYAWSPLPTGFSMTDYVGSVKQSPFAPVDPSSTLILTGTPTLQTISDFAYYSNVYPILVRATRSNPSAITRDIQFSLSMNETVAFTTVPSFTTPLYVNVPITTSKGLAFQAKTYFADASISTIFSPNLRSDLSLTFLSNAQTAYLVSTTGPTSVATGSYTVRASNTNGVSRDTSVVITTSNDTVTFVSPTTVDTCFNFVSHRSLDASLNGYYPSPIYFKAQTESGCNLTYSISNAPVGISFSNLGSNLIKLSGTPTSITSLQNLRIQADSSGTTATANKDISCSVIADQFTFPPLTVAQTTFFVGRKITPISLGITTLSGNSIILYTATNLPAGLSVNPTGVISGTPLAAAGIESTFTIQVQTAFATDSHSYSYKLIADSILIETIADSYVVSTTQPFSVDILASSYSGKDVTLSLTGNVTPYQGPTSIDLSIVGSELIGDLSKVDYLFPGYNFLIQGTNGDTVDETIGRIDIANAPIPAHVGLANTGEIMYSSNQIYRDRGDMYYLGSPNSNHTARWKCGELIYYNRDVTTTERNKVEGYLAWKWGGVSNLPGSHPYKSVAPNPFSPSDISSCYLWFDAADNATIVSDTSSNVVAWESKVSHVRGIFNSSNTQGFTTVVAPKTDVSDIGTQNSIYFNASNARLEISNLIWDSQSRSVFMAYEMVDPTTTPTLGNTNLRSFLNNTTSNGFTFSANTVSNVSSYDYHTAVLANDTISSVDAYSNSPVSGVIVAGVVHSQTAGSNIVTSTGNAATTYSSNAVATSYSTNGFDTLLSWSPRLSNVLDVNQSLTQFLAVNGSTIYSSSNGVSWASITPDLSNTYTRVLTDGSSNWLFDGYPKLYSYSDTSGTFTSNTLVGSNPPSGPSYASLYRNGTYYLGTTGQYTPYLIGGTSSPSNQVSGILGNGLQWKGLGTTIFDSITNSGIQTPAGEWMIGGLQSNGQNLAYSSNGVVWKRQTASSITEVKSVGYLSNVWLAGGIASGSISLMYSSNGRSWSDTDFGPDTVNSIAASSSRFVVGSDAGLSYGTSSSFTGASYSTNSMWRCHDVAYDGTTWVAVGPIDSNNPATTTTLAYSTDGVTWDTPTTTFSDRGTSVAWGSNLWVAIGGTTDTVLTSSDGSTWTSLGSNDPQFTNPISVRYVNGLWVVTQDSTPSTYYSQNGSNWYPFNDAQPGRISVGNDISSSSLYSINATTPTSWTAISNPLKSVYTIQQSNSTLLIGGETGLYKSTNNGSSWTVVPTNNTGTITSLRYKNGVWFAVGTSGLGSTRTLFGEYSSNLSTWTVAFSNVSSKAIGRDILFDGNSWFTSSSGTYPGSTSYDSYLYYYHTAKQTDIGSNWLNWLPSASLSYQFDKLSFAPIFNGTPVASVSIPSDVGLLSFTSPSQTSYILYQYVTISPISITVSGITGFAYFFAVNLPRGLRFVPNIDGVSGSILGAPVDLQIEYSPAYIFVVNGQFTKLLTLSFKVIIPRVIRKQTSAAAYTSLVREYTEVNAAQNAVNARVLPNETRKLGEFMAPPAPDNDKDQVCCVNTSS